MLQAHPLVVFYESSEKLLLGKYDYMTRVIPGLIPELPFACTDNRQVS
ncbi:hypothetical protein [Apilactobacillus kunkeei]|nr:hypothetical protein [Apilactobacillus kunkeei]